MGTSRKRCFCAAQSDFPVGRPPNQGSNKIASLRACFQEPTSTRHAKKHSKHLHFPGAYPRISPRDRPFSPACLQPAWRAFVLLTVTAQQQHAVSLSFGQRNGRPVSSFGSCSAWFQILKGKNCEICYNNCKIPMSIFRLFCLEIFSDG